MVKTCGCNPTLQDVKIRRNPTTNDYLLLCPEHTDLHDEGHGFEVYQHPKLKSNHDLVTLLKRQTWKE